MYLVNVYMYREELVKSMRKAEKKRIAKRWEKILQAKKEQSIQEDFNFTPTEVPQDDDGSTGGIGNK